MKKHVGVIVLAILVIGALLIYTITYQVDELSDIVLIETFGKVTSTLVGNNGTDAGLHFKWPWPIQKVVRYDARTFLFEDTHEQVPTRDGRSLLVTVYCAWRIDNAEQFHRSIRDTDPDAKIAQMQENLRSMVRDSKQKRLITMPISALFNTDPAQVRLTELEQHIQQRAAEAARTNYGVAVVRIGIKSLGLTTDTSKAVIEAMKVQPQEDIKHYQELGNAQARAIEARAESARKIILAFAERRAREIRTRGDQAAAEYYEQFEKEPALAVFLRKVESLALILSGKTQLILDGTKWSGVEMLRKGLETPSKPVGAAPPTGSAASGK